LFIGHYSAFGAFLVVSFSRVSDAASNRHS
jgi:hypothetical protein